MTAVLPDVDLESILALSPACEIVIMSECTEGEHSHEDDPPCGEPAVATLHSTCIDGHIDDALVCDGCLHDLAIGGLVCWCEAEYAAASARWL